MTDDEALGDDVRLAVRMGFTGKLCIHPRQVAVARAALAPRAERLEWVRRVLAVAPDGSTAAVGGQMVDAPVLARARRILAGDPGSPPPAGTGS